MNPSDFENLALKCVMGEASPEEVTLLREACEKSPDLNAQWVQLQADYAQTSEALQTWHAIRSSRGQPAPSAEVIDRLVALANPGAAVKVSHLPSREWWRGTSVKIGLGLAACLVAGFIFQELRSRRGQPSSAGELEHSPSHTDSAFPKTDVKSSAGAPKSAPIPTPVKPGKQNPDADLTPIGSTRFLDPLLSWSGGSPAGDQLTLSLAGRGELTTISGARPPLPLVSILAALGQQPQPGATYEVTLRGSRSRSWTFTLDATADVFPEAMSDSALLNAAEAAAAKGDVLQYLVRLSPSARNSTRAKQIERSLRNPVSK